MTTWKENAFTKASDVIWDLFIKLKLVVTTIFGWFLMGMSSMVILFGPKAELFHWVLVALFADLGFGIWSSILLKKFKISIALYSTAMKFVMYLVLFFMPLILEKTLSNNDIKLGTSIVATLLCSAEFFSICAHMLIIKPDFPVVRIMRKMLEGEISHKLGIKAEELHDYFNNRKNED